MHFVLIGGTRFVGPAVLRHAKEQNHRVTVAHSGTHEIPDLPDVEHLHGTRAELLAPGGAIERARPDVLVDTFAGGATAEKAMSVAICARRAGARKIVAVSSIDVYRYLVEAGIGDGSGQSLLPDTPLPLTESAPTRTSPYPGAPPDHDNAAMETALRDSGCDVAVLRPGAIYGPNDPRSRAWPLIRKIRSGVRRLELPDRGVQVFHQVALDRVARSVVAAAERAPRGFWACNVVDPYTWTYAGLAAVIGRMFDWEWEPVVVPFAAVDHPYKVSSPVLVSDRRLREVLGVHEPDPLQALEEAVRWLWEHGPPADATFAGDQGD